MTLAWVNEFDTYVTIINNSFSKEHTEYSTIYLTIALYFG